jgi:uncharacterized OB-fold protein
MTVRKIPGELPVGFRYTPGVGNTATLEALRDSGVLLGSRCESCSFTYFPARIFCERCFGELSPDAACGPEGTIESWTVGHVGIDEDPLPQPMTIGLIKLDGADTVLMHRLLDVTDPDIGQRVRVRLAANRAGSMLDIEGFEPA